MSHLKDQAICLRTLDWSETSQIVVLLTETHGKIGATAKGSKRQQPSSMYKFSGGIELLALGEAVWAHRPAARLANLTDWDLLDGHWHLRSDLRGLHLGLYAADLVHHLLSDQDAHPATFAALGRLLRDLADRPGQTSALLRFQWSVLEDAGYRPQLDRDAETGGRLDGSAPTLAFSPRAGGIVADSGTAERWRVRHETVHLLRQVAHGTVPAETSGAALERANRLLCTYFRFLLEAHLPTMDLLLGSQEAAV